MYVSEAVIVTGRSLVLERCLARGRDPAPGRASAPEVMVGAKGSIEIFGGGISCREESGVKGSMLLKLVEL